MIVAVVHEVENLAERILDACHHGAGHPRHGSPDETPVVDRANLIDQEVGRATQAAGGGQPDAERLSAVHERRREGNDERRRMLGVEEDL